MERSLLDFAIQFHHVSRSSGVSEVPKEPPEEILGLPLGASPAEARAAYKEKALTAHPDKGGDPKAFCQIRQAYLAICGKAQEPEAASQLTLPAPNADKDFKLKDHRALVLRKFEDDGVDLAERIEFQIKALQELGLKGRDVGSINRNEQGREIHNQCFYLSLARSYLDDDCSMQGVRDTALSLKRVVEAAVLAAHPEWGDGQRVGEEVQAFSDFLFFVLGSHALLSELSVAIFDAASGGVEIYKGRSFPQPEKEAEQRANLLTLRYWPGHYEALVPARSRPSLGELIRSLDACGVSHVTTDV